MLHNLSILLNDTFGENAEKYLQNFGQWLTFVLPAPALTFFKINQTKHMSRRTHFPCRSLPIITGADDFLTKPVDYTSLKEKLKTKLV